jgi:uncharacterized protein (TIGR03437 family)
VVKLDVSGSIVLFREVSGDGSDTVSDLAVDSAGNIFVAGSTTSVYFPVVHAMQTSPGPGFLFKLSADGSQFIWSTYYRESIAGIAVDSSGNVYLTGSTADPQYPITAGLPAGEVGPGPASSTGAFLTKIAAAGDSIVYSTVIVGTGHTCSAGSSCFLSPMITSGVAVAVDAAGDAFMAGNTNTASLPTTPGAPVATGTGAFVGAVKADGSAMTYLTFVGNANLALGGPVVYAGNTATAIAADATGNAYVTGATFDTGFPATPGAFQTAYGGTDNRYPPLTDAYVMKINPLGTEIVWASYLGGNGADSARSIAVDGSGQPWIAGTTASANFPNAQGWISGSDFVTGFSADGARLVYSARYPNDGASRGITADPAGFIHFAGPTGTVSALNPGAAPVVKIFGIANAANGPLDARVPQAEVISIYGPHIGPSMAVTATADSSGNLPTQLAGYQVTMGGNPIPLLYVSDSQINAIVTETVYGAVLKVIGPSFTTPDFHVAPVVSRPEIFSSSAGAAVTNVNMGVTLNAAIAVNQDGTINSQSNPAHIGTYEAIWITGPGAILGVQAGLIATAAHDLHCCSVLLGGSEQFVAYAGYAPGAALGVSQINFLVKPSIAITGNQIAPLFLQAGGVDGTLSRDVTLWVAN